MKWYQFRFNSASLLGLCWSIFLPTMFFAQIPIFDIANEEAGITPVARKTPLYGNGIAATDYDNDGDIDIYLTCGRRVYDRLYQNDGQGHFTDVAKDADIFESLENRTALWMDINGDQMQDLIVAGENCFNNLCADPIRITVYQQKEDHTFVDVSDLSGITMDSLYDHLPFLAVGGMAAGDIDQDGYLDLVFTVWSGGMRLFHNNGDGTFTDITDKVGIANEDNLYWQPMIHDFNDDGKMDIYVNVDFAPNQLWINKGGIFVEEAPQYGLDNDFNEMGMTISDYNNDGDLDIYITNITRHFEGVDQHNILYDKILAKGRVMYREIAASSRVSLSGWDWGTTFADLNNDGWVDLALTNGWNDIFWESDKSRIWLNGLSGFYESSDPSQFNDELSATSLISFDMDRDGDLDLLQTLKENPKNFDPLYLYANQLKEKGNDHHYVVIQPRIDGPNHFAIGSRVTLLAEDYISIRLISAGCSFYGQEPAEAFFGLKERQEVSEVWVEWPNKEVSIYTDISVDEVNRLDYELLAAPAGLTADSVENGILLEWMDLSENESGFTIQRSLNEEFDSYNTFYVDQNITSYIDHDIETDTRYFYRVRAHKEGLASIWSNNAEMLLASSNAGDNDSPKEDIIVFPNPARGEFTVRVTSLYLGTVEIEVMDMTGKLVEMMKIHKDKYTYEVKLGNEYVSGMYLLRVNSGTEELWKKIFIKI